MENWAGGAGSLLRGPLVLWPLLYSGGGEQHAISGTGSLHVWYMADCGGGRQHSGRSGAESRAADQAASTGQRAEQQMGQGKVIRVALGKGAGLICSPPTQKVGPCCSPAIGGLSFAWAQRSPLPLA